MALPSPTTRLAPSPTGALHLGNARTFLINYAIAKQQGMRIVLRVEDLDTPRVREGANEQAIEDLQWLGMTWDEGPYYQAHDLSAYEAAMAKLDAQGLIYPCACTRSEIAAAQSAPHGDEHELRYPGTCRPGAGAPSRQGGAEGERLNEVRVGETGGRAPIAPPFRDGAPDDDAPTALRVIIPDESLEFVDMIAGPQAINVQQHVGDFIVASKAGMPAYQLAVVVDDARQGVTDVVRGDDLISSAARQLWLYRLLGLTPLPRYWHVPLVIGEDSRRLAKRHGDTRIAWCREQGVLPERIIGLVANWSGASEEPRPMSIAEWVDRFEVARLPREPVVFTAKDQQWLLQMT
ncbi:MAG: glutamyl-Q tRNA(Asp) synthetase [Phycisphaeraceae bacterium]